MTELATTIILVTAVVASIAIIHTSLARATDILTRTLTQTQQMVADASHYTRQIVGGPAEVSPTTPPQPAHPPFDYDPGPNIDFDPALDFYADAAGVIVPREGRQPVVGIGVGEELVQGVPRDDVLAQEQRKLWNEIYHRKDAE